MMAAMGGDYTETITGVRIEKSVGGRPIPALTVPVGSKAFRKRKCKKVVNRGRKKK